MYDLIVIGAGPAGANAALIAQLSGLRVLLVDEQDDAGGQIWRAKSNSILKAPASEAAEQGDALRKAVNESNVEVKFGCRLWQIENHSDYKGDFNWFVALQEKNDHSTVTTKALIIATGAQERIIPLPGWTLPGVIGLGGATALFKEHMIVPGQNTLVAGNGPLLFFVASEIIRLGGKVTAVISLNSRLDWLKQLPKMMSNPKMLILGLKWLTQLKAHKVPVYWQYGITKIEGEEQVECVKITKVDKNWKPDQKHELSIEADSVCYGHGLMPAIEATRLAGADHHFDPRLGGWVPTLDQDGRTSQKGLYACGDNSGILGVLAAPHRGRLASLAAFEDLRAELSTKQIIMQRIERQNLKKAAKFGLAATALTIPRSGMVNFMDQDTEICRCEGIIRAEVEAEIKGGGLSPDAIKSATRSGMGPCGGRFCADSVAMISQEMTGKSREDIALPTARPPLRPLSIEDIADDLNYDDLKVPELSPL